MGIFDWENAIDMLQRTRRIDNQTVPLKSVSGPSGSELSPTLQSHADCSKHKNSLSAHLWMDKENTEGCLARDRWGRCWGGKEETGNDGKLVLMPKTSFPCGRILNSVIKHSTWSYYFHQVYMYSSSAIPINMKKQGSPLYGQKVNRDGSM